MPDVVVGASLKVDTGDAIPQIKKTNEEFVSLKKQLKEANQELHKIQEEFGDISPAAIEAAKNVAKIKAQLKDAKEVSDLFNPEKKFQALTGAAHATATGLEAAGGAMALVGSEGADVEKTLLKVQAAMAFSGVLSEVADSGKEFKRLNAIIKETTVFKKADEIATKAAAATQKPIRRSSRYHFVFFQGIKDRHRCNRYRCARCRYWFSPSKN
jgi:chromosome segregation ATPase